LSIELRNKRISHRLYADDIIIIGTMRDSKVGIETVKRWCKNSNMEMNIKKSGCLHIHDDKKNKGQEINGIPAV
jgi:hypothetical protein